MFGRLIDRAGARCHGIELGNGSRRLQAAGPQTAGRGCNRLQQGYRGKDATRLAPKQLAPRVRRPEPKPAAALLGLAAAAT